MRGQSTEQECSLCEDANYVRTYDDGNVCPSCYYCPTDRRGTFVTLGAADFFEYRQYLHDEEDDRLRAVGGIKSAYWGEGSYEFGREGFSVS